MKFHWYQIDYGESELFPDMHVRVVGKRFSYALREKTRETLYLISTFFSFNIRKMKACIFLWCMITAGLDNPLIPWRYEKYATGEN